MDMPSRRYATPDDFVDDFLATLTPGAIPRSEFIDWKSIHSKTLRNKQAFEFYEELSRRIQGHQDFALELADSLLSADEPYPILKAGFEILGHTPDSFVSQEDDLEIRTLAERIRSGDESAARRASEILSDLGLAGLLLTSGPRDVFLGVQIGLQSHRRKNVGGKYFVNIVRSVLNEVCQRVSARLHTPLSLDEEGTIALTEGLSKQVDFILTPGAGPRVGVEVNFYTVAGSKPTEIKRSYGQLLRELRAVQVELIWITDGKGYKSMRRSLRDAYVIFHNVYNLQQARKYLADDLVSMFAPRRHERGRR